MVAGLLLTLIGVADIVRSRSGSRPAASTDAAASRANRRSAIAIGALWVCLGALAWLGLGVRPWAVAVAAAIAFLWLVSTTAVLAGARESGVVALSRAQRSRRRLVRVAGSWPSMLLVVALVVVLLSGPAFIDPAGGFLTAWHHDSGLAFVTAVPLAALVGGVGSSLFLIDSANIVVTSALPAGMPAADPETTADSETRADRKTAADPKTPTVARRSGLWRRFAHRSSPTLDLEPAPPAPELKGGRLIGPIERLLLAGFALAGAFPVVAALIAAKGIVRFPEINRATTGNPAEYFLIGSLVSWATAFALAGMCWLLAIV